MIEMYLETCRKVYNYALRERKDWVNSRKSPINFCSIQSEYIISPNTPRPTYNSQCKSLTDAKKTYPELKEPHSQVLQQTLRILEAAFVNMWERGFGFPRFKKKCRSFLYPSVKQEWVGDGWVAPTVPTVHSFIQSPTAWCGVLDLFYKDFLSFCRKWIGQSPLTSQKTLWYSHPRFIQAALHYYCVRGAAKTQNWIVR